MMPSQFVVNEVLHGGLRCARINSYCLAMELWSKKSFREFITIFNIILHETVNQMNKKIQESHEYKQQRHLQKQRKQDEQGLSVKQTKTMTTQPATKVLYTTSNFVFRDNVSKDEQGLNVRSLFANSYQWVYMTIFPLLLEKSFSPFSMSSQQYRLYERFF